jgi:hypothetical protein
MFLVKNMQKLISFWFKARARTYTPISSLKQTKELFGYGSLTHIHVFWFLVEHTKALVLG